VKICRVKLKLGSKDPLLARICHNIELLLFDLTCYEAVVYGPIDGSDLLSFSCSSLACGFNYVQRCLNIVTVVAHSCGPVAIPRTGM
jgi:hypothetical protein